MREYPQLLDDFEEWDLARFLEDDRDFFDLWEEEDEELEEDFLDPERMVCFLDGFKDDLRSSFFIATLLGFLSAPDFVTLRLLILMLDLRASSVGFFVGIVALA